VLLRETLRKVVWVLLLGGAVALSPGVLAADVRTITAAEAIELATENASALRLAQLDLTMAELRLEAARSALYLPSLSLSISPPELSSSGVETKLGASLGASLSLPWGQGSISANVGLSYDFAASALATPTWQVSLSDLFDLLSPGGSVSSLEPYEEAVDSAAQSLADAKVSLVISTLQTYQSLLSRATQASQNEQSEKRLEASLVQVEALAKDGYKGEQDLIEAKMLLLDAQVQAEKTAAEYAAARETFCRETLGVSEDVELAALDLSMTDLLQAGRALLEAEIPETAIEDADAVVSARQSLEDAATSLTEAKGRMLPSISLSGKLDASEWKVGVGLSFDLFSPSRSADVKIAEANIAVAEERLSSALQSAQNQILDLKSSLLSAVRNGESLELEAEKWILQEKLMTVRHDAGSLSDSDWAEFLDEKDSFAVDAAGRASSLLVAYLTYRNALGVELDWEEWVE
jgi:outer membrane protein TolC